MIVAIQARDVVACAREPDAPETKVLRTLLHELELRASEPLAARVLYEMLR